MQIVRGREVPIVRGREVQIVRGRVDGWTETDRWSDAEEGQRKTAYGEHSSC